MTKKKTFETYRHFVLRRKYNPGFFEDVTVTAKCRVTFPKPGENDMIVDAGFAVCSHKDNFSRKLGRRIADGRFKKVSINYPTVYNPEVPLKVILATMLLNAAPTFLKPYDKGHKKSNVISKEYNIGVVDSSGNTASFKVKPTWLIGSRNSDDFREF